MRMEMVDLEDEDTENTIRMNRIVWPCVFVCWGDALYFTDVSDNSVKRVALS